GRYVLALPDPHGGSGRHDAAAAKCAAAARQAGRHLAGSRCGPYRAPLAPLGGCGEIGFVRQKAEICAIALPSEENRGFPSLTDERKAIFDAKCPKSQKPATKLMPSRSFPAV